MLNSSDESHTRGFLGLQQSGTKAELSTPSVAFHTHKNSAEGSSSPTSILLAV